MESFNRLKENNPELVKRVPYWTQRKIITSLTHHIMETVFEHPEGLKLPNGLGTLVMAGFKIKGTYKYLKLRKTKLDFITTNYHIYRLLWLVDSHHSDIKMPKYWKCITEKLNTRRITKAIRDGRFGSWIIVQSKNRIPEFSKSYFKEYEFKKKEKDDDR